MKLGYYLLMLAINSFMLGGWSILLIIMFEGMIEFSWVILFMIFNFIGFALCCKQIAQNHAKGSSK